MIWFWLGTISLLLCASIFLLPSIWLAPVDDFFSIKFKSLITSILCVLFIFSTYTLYSIFGASKNLTTYLQKENIINREQYKQLRPLYIRLQRELIKNRLNLQLDSTNVDLILNFATIYSQAQHGILPTQLQELLQAVLKIAPEQATALNLLAIHFFKKNDFSLAIDYWQKLLLAFGPHMQHTKAAETLRAKIVECKIKLQEKSLDFK